MHSTEILSFIGNQNISRNPIGVSGTLKSQDLCGSTSDKNKHVILDSKEEWNEFFRVQNDPSTNSTNKNSSRKHVRMDSSGVYKYTAEDENKYNGKEILGRISSQIKEEIIKSVGIDAISFIKLKESKNIDNIVEPAIRFALKLDIKGINMKALISGDMCKEYGVKAITLCFSNEARGLRFRIDNSETRIYEVANGSYQMILQWCAEEKECNVEVNIYDNGQIDLIKGNDVSKEQLAANNIKIGRQFEAKYLHEALASQLP